MRVLAIRGENLASLAQPFELDFEQPPLRDAGLFVITGPTGAGKSTLLDALCLALFDRIPRFSGSRGALLGRGDEEERLSGSDLRWILRRGAGFCFAEVDFLGNDDHRYRARWELRRARLRPEGRLQEPTLSLRRLPAGERIGDKKGETKAAIERLLGLQFEQFRRSVLLAQGDFAAFLKAGVDERAELLERITGARIYTQLSIAAHQRAKAAREQQSALEQRLAELAPLPAEERTALEAECAALEQRLHDLDQQGQGLRQALEWYDRLAALKQEQAQAQEAEQVARHAWESGTEGRAELARVEQAQPLRDRKRRAAEAQQAAEQARSAVQSAEQRLAVAQGQAADADRQREAAEQAERAAEQALDQCRPELAAARALESRLQEAEGGLARAAKTLEEAAARQASQAAALAQLEQQQRECAAAQANSQAWLEDHAFLRPLAAQWERWDELLQRRQRGLAAVQSLAQRRAELTRQQEDDHRRAARLEQQRSALQQDLEARRAILLPLEAAAARTPLQRLRDQREEAQRQRGLWAELCRIARQLDGAGQEVEREHSHLRDNQQASERAALQSSEAAARLQSLEAAGREVRQALEAALNAEQQSAQALRALLRPGEHCPVCGATDHPWAGVLHPLAAQVTQLRERLQRLEGQQGDARGAQARAEAEGAALFRQRQELERRLAVRGQELAQARRDWEATAPPELTAADPAAAPLRQELEQRLAEAEDQLTQRNVEEAAALEQQRRLDELRQGMETRRGEFQRLDDEVHRLQLRREGASAELRHLGEQIDALHAQQREWLQQLAAPLSPLPDWAEEQAVPSEGFRPRCRDRVTQWRRREAEAQQHGERLLQLRQQREAAAARLAEIADALQGQRAEQEASLQRRQEIAAARAALLGGRPADQVEAALTRQREQSRAQREAAVAAQTAAQTALAAAQETLAQRREAWQARQQEAAEQAAELAAALAGLGWSAAELAQRLQYDGAWIEDQRKQAEAQRQRLHAAEILLRERTERLESLRRQAPPLDRAATLTALQENEQTRTDARAAWAAHSARLQEDRRRRAAAAVLQEERAAATPLWELWQALDQLIGSGDGKKFRAFAQSLTLDLLLAQANRHLFDLARRYRLERPPGGELELQVVDTDMGDEVRSIHSLSGGESFLASLALALGLASLSSRQTRVESLFIDEGFGTLDPETLDIALASLDALQSLGRKVGVISHIPTLVERIGVRVVVEKSGGGRSRVHIPDG